ncbi:MAG: arginase family protein [Parvimonas sp.]|uniref:arginase family protein n=1 Tax=Parvimonas sp. TaxID=1944660 RepID=UPI0025DF0ABE|nr:arginase family protein [Parvimonas sp.]MCI5996938.1 arginase family protein [Parvimonas sp.]
MKNPFFIEECISRFNLKNEEMNFIIDELLRTGMLSECENNYIDEKFSKTDFSFFDSQNIYKDNSICILGVPYDGGTTGVSGCKIAPNTLKKFTSNYSYLYNRIDKKFFISYPNIDCYNNQNIVDLGNILTIAGESSYDLHNRLEIAYKNHIKNKDNKIIVVGGDHSITYPILNSFEEDIIFLKFDAHYDDNLILNNIVNHSNFIRKIENIKNIKEIYHIGIREPRKPGLNINGKAITSDDIRNNNAELIFEEYLLNNANFYISIDVDVFDPLIVPATGYTLPYGINLGQICNLIDYFNRIGNIIGVDIVEYNPLLDKNDITMYTVMDLLKYLINILT